jgi:prepilin-type N-terminal cleavage/methylation domain-containing protein
MPFQKPPRRTGVTLIEVVIVIVMIGILASMVTTGWRTIQNRMRDRQGMQQLASLMREARLDAVARTRATGIVIDLPQRRTLRFVDNQTVGIMGQYDEYDQVIESWQTFDMHTLPDSVVCTQQTGDLLHVVFDASGGSSTLIYLQSNNNGSISRLRMMPAAGLIRLE